MYFAGRRNAGDGKKADVPNVKTVVATQRLERNWAKQRNRRLSNLWHLYRRHSCTNRSGYSDIDGVRDRLLSITGWFASYWSTFRISKRIGDNPSEAFILFIFFFR